jgi:hypothetical protein
MAVTGKNGFYEQHTAAADGAGSEHLVSIRKIIWHGFTNAAHTLQIKNGAGDIAIPEIACGAAATVIGVLQFDFPNPLQLVGVETDVLGSGTVVYIYS